MDGLAREAMRRLFSASGTSVINGFHDYEYRLMLRYPNERVDMGFTVATSPDAWVKLDPATDYIGGPYVAIFSPDFQDLLFCSPLPGVRGPIRCAAFDNLLAIVGHSFGEGPKTPIEDELQPSIGGEADGYLLLAEVQRPRRDKE